MIARVLVVVYVAVHAGDYNVMPTDLDVYAPERWADDALFRPEVREAHRLLVAQDWPDALRQLHPASASIHSGSIFVMPSPATPGSASIIFCSVRRWRSALVTPARTIGLPVASRLLACAASRSNQLVPRRIDQRVEFERVHPFEHRPRQAPPALLRRKAAWFQRAA